MEKIHSKYKILKFLLSNKKQEFTIRAIAQKISTDYKATYLMAKQMIGNNTIKAKKAGQTVLCSINEKTFNPEIFKAESMRKQDILKNKNLNVLYKRIIEDLKEPFFILLLFGSYASGKARKESDIDLMLIADKETVKKRINHIISLTPLKIHFIDFNSEEFLSMLKTTEFNVGKEASDNNIILFGIEDYYRLVQNA